MKKDEFVDYPLWRCEDECMYYHIELSYKKEESKYYMREYEKKQKWRDEFFQTFKNLLPQSKLK